MTFYVENFADDFEGCKKLDPDDKAEWCAALRSGNYSQVEGDLHNDKGFCCLGVFCDILEPNAWEKKYEGDDDSSYIHPMSSDFGGIIHEEFLPRINLDSLAHDRLAELNDSGLSFEQIAKLIEKYL